ncbi:MAG TPA: HEAT repeat domain-containing protein [Methanoregulaceae archaeon]|jgi:HEAT repeat protein|nr:HEAT repeat domain-containing protein [Methanolinea sp.]MDD3091304.1 HEAT repeat domain-containing protein [Methanoregulaceae archaeon]MDD5049399.1 HEAT repeat domain-containing protein [Methanoregulaceae archaeon]MDD5685316.1 HEAT repeat domain-containing protein [Methanoregulaceae archaeon]HOP66820.1 HEAT repeat domain-containing protein [Methanoregulaceae archaeon]
MFADLKTGGIDRYKPVVLGVFLVFSVFLEIVVHLVFRIDVVYTHFFYIPIVLGAIWYGTRGVVIAILLAALLLSGAYYADGMLRTGPMLRALIFLVVALVIGVVSDIAKREQKRMINEVADAALRSGMETHGIRGNLEEIKLRVLSSANVQKMKDERNVRGLVLALKHRDPAVAYEAVEALGEIGDPAAAGPLTEALTGDKYSGLRWKAAEALTQIGTESVPYLINALENPDEDVRWKAAISLGEIGDRRAIDPLINLLGDEDRFVRSRAAYALGIMGELVIQPLAEVLSTEKNPDLRLGAVMALGRIQADPATRLLIRATTDSSGDVRQEAMTALAATGREGLLVLLDALKFAEKREKINIIRVLGEIGSKDAIEPLMQLLETADADARPLIIQAIADLGGPEIATHDGEKKGY